MLGGAARDFHLGSVRQDHQHLYFTGLYSLQRHTKTYYGGFGNCLVEECTNATALGDVGLTVDKRS